MDRLKALAFTLAAVLGCSADVHTNAPRSVPAASATHSGAAHSLDAGQPAQASQPEAAAGAGAGGSAPPTSTPACNPPRVDALFGAAAAAAADAIIEHRPDGTIVTHGAGRVRGRHELEGSFNQFLERYFENRSYAFLIEDTVAAGGGSVKFTYLPEAPVSSNGPTTNFRHWKIYGNGNVFHSNVSMQPVSDKQLEFTVDRNARENRAMQSGDILEFEFGIFIAGQDANDPGAIEGRTSYYTDTFRYRVGQGGLTADNADTSGTLGPSDDARVAGTTTIPWIYAEPELYISQMVLDMQPPHVQPFLRGRRLFHTDFGSGEHSEPGNPIFEAQAGKLGSMSVAPSCVSCHERDGRGRPPEPGAALSSMVVKLYGPAALGDQLQTPEGRALLDHYESHPVELGDGTQVMLQRPVFRFEGVDAATLSPSIRIARQIPGAGLLEAIPEQQILARADETDCDLDGISGRAQRVADPDGSGSMRLGRFGWKAEKISVAHQVADALQSDLDIGSPVLAAQHGQAQLEPDDFDDLVAYSSLIALPARRNASDAQVIRGQGLFTSIGCVHCHAPDAETGDNHPLVELRGQQIHPYSDLLLHEMGEDLADGSGSAQASEWRTPPLWGIGLLETVNGEFHLLHDGRAHDPIEAVLWHGGEAAFARAAVMQLDAEDRAALLAFLRSL